MARFRYRAFNAEGSAVEGAIVAETEREAARVLERRGLTVVAVEAEVGQAGAIKNRRVAKLRQRDLSLAFHELATLLVAGVGLAEAVAAQVRGARHPRLLVAFEGVSLALRQGQAFSDALEASGLPFPRYAAVLVRSGEKSGLLGQALRDVVAQMEFDQSVSQEMRQALTYPAVLVFAGLGAVIMMFTFVVPKFASLLKNDANLPFLALAVLRTGMFLREWYWLVALILAALVAWVVGILRMPARRARLLESMERLPVIGLWRVEAETAGWARVLGTLLSNKVSLMEALALAQSSVLAPGRKARLEEVSRQVRAGTTLADALEEQQTLNPTGYNLIRVGERSGELPAMLQTLAHLSETAGRARIKQFLALLEPAAILMIGGAV
ncbi:MAG: type II secretion system F family protein, partial [Rhodanobacter sp.]